MSNKEVLRRANAEKRLIRDIRKRQLSSLGHIMRKEKIENLMIRFTYIRILSAVFVLAMSSYCWPQRTEHCGQPWSPTSVSDRVPTERII